MAVMYDYECQGCAKVFEEVRPYEERTIECSCGAAANRIVSRTRRAQLDIFEAQHFDELGDDNPYISSKRQLAEECEKRGLKSRLLMEGYHNSGRPRWV